MPIESKAALEFQAKRRRPDARCDYPISSFGAEGDYIFWLPTPGAMKRTRFVEGKPIVEIVGACLDDPAIVAARETVLKTLSSHGPGLLSVDIAFLGYAAAVILKNYDLTDEELTMVLDGTKWHDGMMRHLVGGDDFIESLLQHGPELAERLHRDLMEAQPQPQGWETPVAEDLEEKGKPKRRRRWWRLWRLEPANV